MKRWLFNLWFRLAPRAAMRWVNGKLENAARVDQADRDWEQAHPKLLAAKRRINSAAFSIYLRDHSDLAQE